MACSGHSGVVGKQGIETSLFIVWLNNNKMLQKEGLSEMMLCFVGALLCVLGFISAIIVSTLDKIGMRQLGLDGAIQEESRKVVRTVSYNNTLFF